tara:strand:- start:1808 stop:2185 length:378 start_codon:yes stop_codon:yes gene_type:complete
MSRLNRKQLRRMLLKEFKMIGMASPDVGMLGHSPFPSPQPDLEYDHPEYGHREVDNIGSLGGDEAFGIGFEAGSSGAFSKGGVSKEDCCEAILCLIECCDCPDTKAIIRQCCEDIMAGAYDDEPC